MSPETIILQTRQWITDVVVGCNFCPFAAREVKRNSIHYEVLESGDTSAVLQAMLRMLEKMDENDTIETAFIILPTGFEDFHEYLDLTEEAEQTLADEDYEGVYQVASFHPGYLFAGAPEEDAANYTNRSPYPMLHVLREDSISKALEHYKDPEDIPERNITFARNKGTVYMKMLRDACMGRTK